jgi:hypothetical protein
MCLRLALHLQATTCSKRAKKLYWVELLTYIFCYYCYFCNNLLNTVHFYN